MTHKLIFCSVVLAGLMSTALTSCSNDKDYGDPMSAVTLIKDLKLNVGESLPLAVGMSKKVEATITNEGVTKPELVWSSSNTSVATVSQDGTIEAKALGTTSISISDRTEMRVIKQISVTVMPVATDVKLEDQTMFEETSRTLSVAVTPINAYNVFSWKSSDETVATVDSTGTVTALKPGTATITLTTLDGSNKTASAKITVNKTIPLEDIELSSIGYDLGVGDKGKIVTKLVPENAVADMLNWTSSNEGVAKVGTDGTVTGVAVGTAKITATDPKSGMSKSIDVTIGTGTINQNFGEGLGKWTKDDNISSIEYKGDHAVITMKTGGKMNAPLRLANAVFNVGTYRYMAIKLLRPGKYAANWNGNGTIFMDLDNTGRYIGNEGNGNNKYSIVGYDNPANAPEDKPVVIYFDLQKNFGTDYYLSKTGTETKGFRLGIYDIPASFANTFDLYWVHTFKTMAEMEAFVNSGK